MSDVVPAHLVDAGGALASLTWWLEWWLVRSTRSDRKRLRDLGSPWRSALLHTVAWPVFTVLRAVVLSLHLAHSWRFIKG